MAKIDSAYAYYASTYANKEVSRYDSHKKSELRKIYNRIIKTNKESPLYKISNMSEAKKYAIDIKESSKAILNAVDSLSDKYADSSDSFQKKVAESSNEDAVGVRYVGDGSENKGADGFDIEVRQLAAPQVNTGSYLDSKALSFIPGSYSFDINTNASSYEFQFGVSTGETNGEVQDKLKRLINASGLGIEADIVHDDSGKAALQLTSMQTGLSETEDSLFSVAPSANAESISMMKQLGIDKVSSPAHNSDFSLNGTAHSSLSNTFTINNAFELTLKKPTTDTGAAAIGFKTNSDAVADNVQTLVDAYNKMIDVADDYSMNDSADATRLLRDISSITKGSQSKLSYIGLMTDDDGKLTIDRDILAGALSPDRADDTFNTLTALKDAIGDKANSVTVNPMNYVQKVVVAYKNPGHNFNTPYISSIYSGMMLDSYA